MGEAMQRVCFLMQLKRDRISDYMDAHATVWPAMREELRRAGWSNYSLHIRESDGLVVGYVETEDFELAQERMSKSHVNARWQQTMAPYFDHGSNPDESIERLTEYFHLQ